jgi:type I restriction enzyme, S subunit
VIPDGWQALPNKRFMREIDERSTQGDEELLSVSHLTGVTPRSEKSVTMFMAESLVNYKRVRREDLVVNTMWAWMGAAGVSLVDGIVSPSYATYRFNSSIMIPRYFDYVIRTPSYIAEMTKYSKGVWTSRLRIYPEDFLRLTTVVPPIQTQQLICDFLDAETARIDAFIAKKLRLVELIGGRHQTWLDQLFAQNSRRYRLKHLLKQPPCYGVLVPSFTEDGVPFIRVNDITMLKDRSGALVQIDHAQSREYRRTVVRAGDVLLSVVGSIDKVAVVSSEVAGANVARAVARLVPAASVPPELLAQWLTTTQYIDQARLSTLSDTAQPTLNMGDLANFEVSFPKPEARETVLQRSRAELRRYRNTELLLLRQISLLQERRKALITAAVTGELEIPDGVAGEQRGSDRGAGRVRV